MNFETFFKSSSYALVLAGMLALLVAGGVGVFVALIFIAAMVLAWYIEDSKWQISERVGLIIIFAMLPLFYLDYKYKITGGYGREQALVASLSRIILALAAIKLLQVKTDRDWFVIYLLSFFEILLSAAFSISPAIAAAFLIYIFLAVSTIITFEVRKSSQGVSKKRAKLFEALQREPESATDVLPPRSNYRFPLVAVYLLIMTLIVAVPLFFFLPRVGGAGLGAGTSGLKTSTGFSESVRLGAIANIQQNDEIVMRVRLESGASPREQNFKWRGVALDTFDKLSWTRSKSGKAVDDIVNPDGLFKFDTESGNKKNIIQSVYLEPMDSSTLFGLSRMIGIRGNFPSLIRDYNESVSNLHREQERINYKVISDTYLPPESTLRQDRALTPQSMTAYEQLPAKVDPRFAQLTREVIQRSGAANHYDAAKAVETYLQTQFGYTLDLRAGGDDPLADFLFNVREGHCEYFASAMAIMLRTQGYATRIVNGFQSGEYNETAGLYIVRQRDAHSWVEVYFPQTDSWVPFDPTPAAGLNGDGSHSAGIFSALGSYMDALDSLWVQYVVAYDNQEQVSLFRTVKQSFTTYQAQINTWLNSVQNELTKRYNEARGEDGMEKRVTGTLKMAGILIAFCLAVVLLLFGGRFLYTSNFFGRLFARFDEVTEGQVIEFYARMVAALTQKGMVRPPYQTPMEFAGALAIPQAVRITEAYNGVRFGERILTPQDRSEIESWLSEIEAKEQKD
jgi:transglutaminase-like putative cysteine protease